VHTAPRVHNQFNQERHLTTRKVYKQRRCAALAEWRGRCQTNCLPCFSPCWLHAMSNPFRYFNSSPEVIRLVVMMYVKYPLSLRNIGGSPG
jgi:hypothetical protein